MTYGQVDRITTNLAYDFYGYLGDRSVIPLLEDHSPYYLILIIALYKLQISVMLISTRNSSEAIIHLLKQVNAETLLYGESYHHAKKEVLKGNPAIECFAVPRLDLDELVNPDANSILDQNFTSSDLLKTVLIIHK